MVQKKVVITIAPDGETTIDAQGFTGQSCSLATREMELALAGDAGNVSDRKKPDFYATTGVGQSQAAR